MSQYTLDVPSLDSLKKQWQRSLRFGVLVAPLYPAPGTGDQVEVRVRCTWEAAAFEVRGRVVQVSEGGSVMELAPLGDEVRATLVKLGIPDAADAPPPRRAAPPPPPPRAAQPPPPPPAGARPPGPPASPPPGARPPGPPAPPPPGARPPGPATAPPAAAPAGFRPRPVAFSPPQARPPGPGSSQPPAGPQPGPPPSSAVQEPLPSRPPPVAAAPRQAEDQDTARIAASDGPATTGAEALLPPATLHGDFSRVSWRDALLHFFEQRSTGVLAIEAFREIRWCFLIDGRPVHYLGDRPHPGELLSDALVADGVVDMATWTAALRVQRITGRLAGEHLVARGVLERTALDRALHRRAERITRNLMGMNFGTFRFHDFPDVRDVYRHQAVDVLGVLLSHQRESLDAVDNDRLVQKVEGFYPLHVRPVAARAALLAQLPLAEDEGRLVRTLLPACWTLGEMVALREMEERRLVRLLFALKALGMVEFARDEGAGGRRNRAERILYSGLKDLNRRNDFDALHSHWSSSHAEIEAGYQRVIRENGRERFESVADDRIEELVRAIRKKADETWSRLNTREGRKEARKRLVGVDQLRMASDLLDKQGEMAAFKGEVALVRACAERILELDPGGPEGIENLKRAQGWLADPRIAAATGSVDLEALSGRLDERL